ncbi:hypothetical protein QR680_012969 [Steinernema hermaphroditum]|uniref:tryptophan--tRNA ligase n=1 Tax=Steinernema hermaphroditum TaxID=289476 RepID=A0AA39I3X9_9BILA|nr:hypothetical protein QR680_012969 [Steinernema hermaphroditum]
MLRVVSGAAQTYCRVGLRAASSGSSSSNTDVWFSGIQPTGVPHIGNYLGFIEPWIDIQENARSGSPLLLSIVDLHAMTVGPVQTSRARSNIREMCAGLLACGVDHEETILFQQSDIAEHTQLAWFLGSLQTITKLQRMPQYKDKSKKFKNGQVPLGLLNYPVLQAADVLLYKGTHVAVGEDQTQHMNLLTDLARNFNGFYETDFFPIPKQVTGTHARVKSLSSPDTKMSKSDPSSLSRIEISDSREMVFKKCRRALSDVVGDVTYDPMSRPGVANLLHLYAAFTKRTIQSVTEEFAGNSVLALKDRLAEVVDERLEPIRQSYHSLLSHTARIDDILDYGNERAVVIARRNMANIKNIMGLK